MYIFNITFSVEPEIEQEYLSYLKNIFIPNMLKSGLLKSAKTGRVISDHIDSISYAVQFETDLDSLKVFKQNELDELLEYFQQKFLSKVLYFMTELEIVDRQ